MWALIAAAAFAQDTYVVDATRSVVLSNSETMAMGGAGLAPASAADGLFYNPAAAATRTLDDTDRFTWNYSLSWLTVGPGDPIDLGNVGSADGWQGGMLNLGVSGMWGNAGAGVVGQGLTYQQTIDDDVYGRRTFAVDVNEGHVDVGGATRDGQLVVGVGLRLLSFTGTADGRSRSYTGQGLEAGLRLSDANNGWSTGLIWRDAVRATEAGGDLELPVDTVRLPMQLGLGVAWASRAVPASRFKVPIRFAGDVVYNGPVAGGVALEGLLQGKVVGKGHAATLSPRLGVEVEPWVDRLRLRGGGYIEPTRTSLAGDRLHATGGFELRLFRLKALWGLIDTELSYETVIDAAPRYLNLSWISIGTWRRGWAGSVGYAGPMGRDRAAEPPPPAPADEAATDAP